MGYLVWKCVGIRVLVAVIVVVVVVVVVVSYECGATNAAVVPYRTVSLALSFSLCDHQPPCI